jgi:GT2 family glycosyltransferase
MGKTELIAKNAMESILTVSIVVYKQNQAIVARAVESVLNCPLACRLYVIENSPAESVKHLCKDARVIYTLNKNNIGFARAHNIAMRESLAIQAKYHLVMNPDVYFEKGTLEKMIDFIDKNHEVGALAPKILYPDGSIQYLCKLLPAPWESIYRRFCLSKKLLERINEVYELRFSGYNKIMEAPHLSGCFLLLRNEVLEKAGLFDERFFMYFEDVDLTRRIYNHSKTVYFPDAVVFHHYAKGSYKNIKLLIHHIASAARYFNKWGYILDADRKRINAETLHSFGCAGKYRGIGCRTEKP